jgi:hypothetical protein
MVTWCQTGPENARDYVRVPMSAVSQRIRDLMRASARCVVCIVRTRFAPSRVKGSKTGGTLRTLVNLAKSKVLGVTNIYECHQSQLVTVGIYLKGLANAA